VKGLVLAIGLAWALVAGVAAPAQAKGEASLSAAELQTWRAAFKAAHTGHWAEARRLAAQGHDKLIAKVLHWYDLARPGGDASFDELAEFITRNPDWPTINALRAHAEDALPDDMAPSRVKAWFERNPPVSTTGRVRYAEAMLALGEPQGLALIRSAWIEGNFGERQEQIFLFRHHQQLRPQDHVARLDRLLWDGQVHAARAMLRRVDAGHAALAEARIGLADLKPGVEWWLRRVPPELRNDPGLLFDRARWRRRKGHDDEARAILLHPPAELVRPELWWQERGIAVHRALAQGYVTDALHLAERNGQTPGTTSYADAEWLSGWIALRLLREPARALAHFQNMAEAVRWPISRARAHYWEGRALSALGRTQAAAAAYSAAAQFGMTYYGQLAALRLDPAARPALPPPPTPSPAAREAFDRQELVRAVRALGQLGEDELRETFIKCLAIHADGPEAAELVADLAVEQTRPDLAVKLVRQTWHGEVPLTVHSFPVRDLPHSVAAERALVLSVIRQESAFDAKAISRAGALGLMQLMPATARKTASGLGLGFANSRLTDDPDYNVRLGSAYLAHLLDDFGGNYVLAIAAYNAGPSRVRQWMRDNGDPRSRDVDVVDWIEMIPFDETRNYVQRVLEALHIYRVRLGGTAADDQLASELHLSERAAASASR
jgi:soluble lytic murein transglycosylase